MNVVLALEHLYDSVVAQFAADAAAHDPPLTPVPQAFGWREPARRRGTTHRIVWVPGDDKSGSMGAVGPARNPGRDPRPLATIREAFTVYVEATDLSAAENELAQWKAARLLFDAWLRCVYKAAHGTFAIGTPAYLVERKERRHGVTIRVPCTIEAMVPDEPATLAPEDLRAEIDLDDLDHSEAIAIPDVAETEEAPEDDNGAEEPEE